MDDDHRRVHAALVGIAQFGAKHASAFGRLKLNGFQKQTRQYRGTHFAHGSGMGLRYGLPNRPQALAFLGRYMVQLGELQKCQTALNGALQQISLVSVHRIPFIDCQHHRPARLQDVTSDVRVLVGHTLGGVKQEQSDIGGFNRLQGFDHREFFNGFKDFALSTQSCRVNQLKLLALAFKGNMDSVAGGAWQVEGHQALLAQPSIDQGRFAHIGATHHGKFQWLGRTVVLFVLVRQVQRPQGGIQHAADTLAMGGRHGHDLAQAEFEKLHQAVPFLHALGFVGHQQTGLA